MRKVSGGFGRGIALFLVLLFTFSPAYAAARSLAAAQSEFDAGNFASAAVLARKLRTAKGDALASRAEAVRGEFMAEGEERLRRFQIALADGRRALSRDPALPEAHLAIAVALGLVARSEGGVKAHFEGLGTQARAHIGKALALDEGNAWAHAALGGWHLEIVYEGGLLGAAVYGASFAAGIAAYERALELDPGNVSIAWQYAFQLSGFDGVENRARAAELLADMLARPPGDALEEILCRSAEHLQQALEKNDKAEAARIVSEGLGRRAPPASPASRNRTR
ncbi:hypothetical protein [Parvibaculum sp.]|uniref:hypothetical protein n=1 Tax=Parvibaculum sp. TaxID=2024848 RepID=UPI003BA86EB9